MKTTYRIICYIVNLITIKSNSFKRKHEFEATPLILQDSFVCNLIHVLDRLRQIFCRTEIFSNSFLPQTIRESNQLDTQSPRLLHIPYFAKHC